MHTHTQTHKDKYQRKCFSQSELTPGTLLSWTFSTSKMTNDDLGSSYIRAYARNGTGGVALANAADISVIVVYFLVVLVVGIWVSDSVHQIIFLWGLSTVL